MNNKEFKIKLINDLSNRNIYTKMTQNNELVTRCPYCGDSTKNLNTGHLYIRINPNDNYPIVYNCFKCPAHGLLRYEDLELLGIAGPIYQQHLLNLNKTSDKLPKSYSINECEQIDFSYKIPDPITNSYKLQYIENRLGVKFTLEDYKEMKVITSLKDFIMLNNITTITCKPEMANLVEKYYVGFLSNNGAYILFRDITNKSNIRWYKYPITQQSYGQQVMYSLTNNVDIFTDEDIVINLSEGVLDCLSIRYNIDKNSQNTINIAVCGKFYSKVIKYLFGLGFIGKNIIINIYSDNDGTYDTGIEYYYKTLKKYTYLVKEINVFYNTIEKDVGVPSNRIKLTKTKL